VSDADLLDPPQPFGAYRPLMFSIAYRMLGSAMKAEDVLQEDYLRCRSVPPETIRSPKAYRATVVTRLCLNQLESARAQRETYVGAWLPEPILTEAAEPLGALALPPAQQAELHESISLAFLVLLEQLSPVERAVYLLRGVFDCSYAEIAQILDKDEAASRQLLSRARQHIAHNRPRFAAAPEQHRRLLEQFMQAVSQGEVNGLVNLLSEDVTLWADAGGKVRGAATRPLHGSLAVAQFVLASTRFLPPHATAEVQLVNGRPAIVVRASGQATFVIAIDVDGDRVRVVRVLANPDKLRRV